MTEEISMIEKGGAILGKGELNKIIQKKINLDYLRNIDLGLPVYFEKIKDSLKEYMDMEEDYYNVVVLWIIGTYFHKQFPSYPYLFFNAMKSSGKSRILNIISHLSKNGYMVGSMTEAVLFRLASVKSFCIDELEQINEKGKENLRMLLNSAYKRGMKVPRLKKTKDGGQELEEFEVYTPIAMANIWGMENVLADRCISIILEKSSRKDIIKLTENFEDNWDFQQIKGGLLRLTEKLEGGIFHNLFSEWNSYVKSIVNGVNRLSSVSEVNSVNNKGEIDTIDTIDTYKVLFSKINKTDLSGRDLELFLPLFILADFIGENVLEELMKTSKKLVKLRKEADREENKDVKLIEFIAQATYEGYVDVSRIAQDFSEFFGEDPKYNTSNSISRALNRLKLISEKRSTGKKRQVKLNILKAQEKLLLFKEPESLNQFTDEELKEAGLTRETLQEALE